MRVIIKEFSRVFNLARPFPTVRRHKITFCDITLTVVDLWRYVLKGPPNDKNSIDTYVLPTQTIIYTSQVH